MSGVPAVPQIADIAASRIMHKNYRLDSKGLSLCINDVHNYPFEAMKAEGKRAMLVDHENYGQAIIASK
jgi:hypothetical protein